MELKIGLTAQSSICVTKETTAAVLGSGDLDVFATPAMIALMENAAMKAVAEALPEGATTVGTAMNATHIKASAIGAQITATATVTEVDGRKITLRVEASDEAAVIGEGVHTRFIVDRVKFMSKL